MPFHILSKVAISPIPAEDHQELILLSSLVLEYSEFVMILFKGHVFFKQHDIVIWLLTWNWKVWLSFSSLSLASNVTLTDPIWPHLFNHQKVDTGPENTILVKRNKMLRDLSHVSLSCARVSFQFKFSDSN